MNIVQVYREFPSHESCLDHLERVRWNGTPICPYCKSIKATPYKNEKRYHCNTCKTSFSVTVGTIFHDTKLDLQKWFLAIALVLDAKKGISARQLARHIEVNKNTAWYMNMRIRRAMLEQREMLEGIVEMDETYIGGKPRKGGNGGDKLKRGRGTKKTPVIGMVERGGRIRAKVIGKGKMTAKTLSALVRKNVDTENAVLVTDEYKGYVGISRFMPHKTINHQLWYVNGEIHTNTIESFWALLKRGIVGQYHKVSLRYLPKYMDEFCYRHNNRKNEDLFGLTISRAVGGMQ
ncbi:MAG: IS1595 family transposase [Syntrophales bacterium]|nr:IS1595 family transposase [Syntrophales bacterium]